MVIYKIKYLFLHDARYVIVTVVPLYKSVSVVINRNESLKSLKTRFLEVIVGFNNHWNNCWINESDSVRHSRSTSLNYTHNMTPKKWTLCVFCARGEDYMHNYLSTYIQTMGTFI